MTGLSYVDLPKARRSCRRCTHGKGTTLVVPSGCATRRGFSRWGPWVQLESWIRGAITVLGWIRHKFRHDGILVDVYKMSGEILRIADAMVGESFLPDLAAADLLSDCVRVAAFYELHRAFQRDVHGRRDEQMCVVEDYDEGVQLESPFTAIVIEGLQE